MTTPTPALPDKAVELAAAAIDPWAFDPAFNQGSPEYRQRDAREKARAALLAAAPAMQEWRTIESAPKDGEPLLGFMPTYYQGVGGQSVILWQDDAWWDSRAFKTDPTHWMPLPSPPQAKDGAAVNPQ